MKIAIDLTWVKPKKSGGTESYIRNLLDGFLELKNDAEIYLFTAKDNDETFSKYEKDKRFKRVLCNINANDVGKRIIWQNLFIYKKMKKHKINFIFFPTYGMPLYKPKKIYNVTTIHDLQALHYKEYFSKVEYLVLMLGWKTATLHSNRIIATTNYVKKDIETNLKHKNNVVTINIPIVLNNEMEKNFKTIEDRYQIKKNEYYYTVASLLPHKNLIILIKVIHKIKKDKLTLPNKLVISGVGGGQKDQLLKLIEEYDLKDNIILTSFVENAERNALIKNCNTFLFPSIFEGFGMPPLEAMAFGSKVITTTCTSLKEVTQGKCYYVDDPKNVDDWIKQISKVQKEKNKVYTFKEYDKVFIASQCMKLFEKVIKE